MQDTQVTIRLMLYADQMSSRHQYFLLEDKEFKQLDATHLQTTLLCGLTPTVQARGQLSTVATRYVRKDNVAYPLRGDEWVAQAQFERASRAKRASSVYYRLSECGLVARLAYVQERVGQQSRVVRSRLQVYTFKEPPSTVSTNSMPCRPMSLSPRLEEVLTRFLLTAIWSRDIFGDKLQGGVR